MVVEAPGEKASIWGEKSGYDIASMTGATGDLMGGDTATGVRRDSVSEDIS